MKNSNIFKQINWTLLLCCFFSLSTTLVQAQSSIGFGDGGELNELPETDKWYQIQFKHSGKCLDNGSTVDVGKQLHQWELIKPSNPAYTNQFWKLEDAGEGYYYLMQSNGRVMEVGGGEMNVGKEIIQWEKVSSNGDNQLWILEDAGDDYFRLQNRKTSMYLEIADNSTKNNAKTQQNVKGGDNQLVKFIPITAPLVGKTFHIKNTYGGSGHEWYGALLSSEPGSSHPMVTVEKNNAIKWKFEAVPGKANHYKIVNTSPGKWNGASISWDNGDSHPMISVEHNDPVEWRMDPVPGKANHYKIVNTYAGNWQGASISWDSGTSYPHASLEFNDPVEWELVPVK